MLTRTDMDDTGEARGRFQKLPMKEYYPPIKADVMMRAHDPSFSQKRDDVGVG